TEVGGQELIEPPGRVFAGSGSARKPHLVVNDVVGIHGDCPLNISGALRLQVLLYQGDHLVLFHAWFPFVPASPDACACVIIMRWPSHVKSLSHVKRNLAVRVDERTRRPEPAPLSSRPPPS